MRPFGNNTQALPSSDLPLSAYKAPGPPLFLTCPYLLITPQGPFFSDLPLELPRILPGESPLCLCLLPFFPQGQRKVRGLQRESQP